MAQPHPHGTRCQKCTTSSRSDFARIRFCFLLCATITWKVPGRFREGWCIQSNPFGSAIWYLFSAFSDPCKPFAFSRESSLRLMFHCLNGHSLIQQPGFPNTASLPSRSRCKDNYFAWCIGRWQMVPRCRPEVNRNLSAQRIERTGQPCYWLPQDVMSHSGTISGPGHTQQTTPFLGVSLCSPSPTRGPEKLSEA